MRCPELRDQFFSPNPSSLAALGRPILLGGVRVETKGEIYCFLGPRIRLSELTFAKIVSYELRDLVSKRKHQATGLNV